MSIKTENPLSDLISDEIYNILNEKGLINEKNLRDYQMRKRFKELRDQNTKAGEAIDKLKEEYPYLQFDTIRKIVYHIQK